MLITLLGESPLDPVVMTQFELGCDPEDLGHRTLEKALVREDHAASTGKCATWTFTPRVKDPPKKLRGTASRGSWLLDNLAKGLSGRVALLQGSEFFERALERLKEHRARMLPVLDRMKDERVAFSLDGCLLHESADEAKYKGLLEADPKKATSVPGRCIIDGCTSTTVARVAPTAPKGGGGIMWGPGVNSDMGREPWGFIQTANTGICYRHYQEKFRWLSQHVKCVPVGKSLVVIMIPARNDTTQEAILEQVGNCCTAREAEILLDEASKAPIQPEDLEEALRKRIGLPQNSCAMADYHILVCAKNNFRAGILDWIQDSPAGLISRMVGFRQRFRGLSAWALAKASLGLDDAEKAQSMPKSAANCWIQRLFRGTPLAVAETDKLVSCLTQDVANGAGLRRKGKDGKEYLSPMGIRYLILEDAMTRDEDYASTPAYHLGRAFGALKAALRPGAHRDAVSHELVQACQNPSDTVARMQEMVAIKEKQGVGLFFKALAVYQTHLCRALPLSTTPFDMLDRMRALKGYLDEIEEQRDARTASAAT